MDEQEIFIAALERGTTVRGDYLDEACAGNSELRRRVERLLAAHENAASFLDRPAGELAATTDQPMTEGPGAVIGPYKLLQEIGEGGMGVVYMAEQKEPVERQVALKIIKPGMDTRQVIARFEAERHALAMMDHPNIARVLDAGTTDSGRPYFVMELVKGVPITQYCDCDEHHLGVRQRLELFVQVCHAVQHAHQKGIIHRDLKPTNILVAEYDDRPVPKIIDFGVAKAVHHESDDTGTFTGAGLLIGTPLYMSPEQASGGDVDTRSDVYSLGVVLYELLTGSTPFQPERVREAGYDEIRRIIREEEPPTPSARISTLGEAATTVSEHRQTDPPNLRRLLHGDLDWIVMKALEKDRDRRYQTAADLARDIERYLADEPIQARPPSLGDHMAKWARRHRAAVWASVAAGLVAVVMLVVSSLLVYAAYEREKDQRRLAEASAAEAQEQEQRAEANLDLALKALDAVYLEAVGTEKLVNRPAATRGESESWGTRLRPLSALECDLLNRGLNFYGQFAQQNPATSRARAQAAGAYLRVGLLHAGLGDGPKAAEAYREAIGRFEQLANEEPTQVEHFRQLGEAYWNLANTEPRLDAAKKILEKSQSAFSTAIGLSPHDGTLYLRRATAFWYTNPDRSAQDYSRAAELDPRNLQVLLTCSNHFRLGDIPKARQFAERALGLAPNDPACHVAFAHVAPDAAAALEHYARAIELAPNDASGYAGRGQFYRTHGDPRRALPDLNRALELNSNDHWTLQNRAQAFRNLGEYDSAIADLTKFLKIWPHEWVGWRDLGWAYMGKKDWQAAVAPLTKAVEINAQNAVCFLLLGDAQLELHNWQAAADAFAKAVEVNPTAPYARYLYRQLAFAHFQLKNYDAALADLAKASELNPGELHNLSRIPLDEAAKCPDPHFREGLLELARKTIEGTKGDPRAYRARADLSIAFGQPGDFDRAIADYREAIRRDPKGADDVRQWAAILEKSVSLAEKDAKLSEKDRKALVRGYADRVRGLMQHAGPPGKDTPAARDLHEALRLGLDDPQGQYHLGNVLLKQGAWADAEAWYRRALRVRPDFPDARGQLGYSLWKQGKHAEAESECREVLRLHPGDAGAYFTLGLVLYWGNKTPVAHVRFYVEADAAHPKMADDLRFPNRYNAACAAALAGCGGGEDSAKLDEKERARLRGQALEWLRADLTAWRQLLEKEKDKARACVQERLRQWQQDAVFAGVRGSGLAGLPEAERQPWQQLWADVEETLERTRGDTKDAKK